MISSSLLKNANICYNKYNLQRQRACYCRQQKTMYFILMTLVTFNLYLFRLFRKVIETKRVFVLHVGLSLLI